MKTGKDGLIVYGPQAIEYKQHRGWFRKPYKFKMHPGDRLTMIPVSEPRKFSFLYLLWLRYAPKIWKDYKRHRSHMKFLDVCAYPKDANIRNTFGNKEYIESEKDRVMRLPPVEFNNFDARQRTPAERRESLHKAILSAIDEVKAKNKVKE